MPHLVIRREFEATIDRVWEALVNPFRLERWIGTYAGNPASGRIEFAMTSEAPDAAPSTCVVHECTAPTRVDLELAPMAPDAPGWRLIVALEAAGERTRVEFSQPIDPEHIDVELAASIGPGWEYYLDRWAAVAVGADVDAVEWESYFPAQRDHYRAVFAQ